MVKILVFLSNPSPCKATVELFPRDNSMNFTLV